MPGRKYPLDPLVNLRERKVEEKTRALAGAVSAHQAAEQKRRAAEAARASADDAAAKTRERERAALESGVLRAGDLHAGRAWEFGVAEERKRLTQQVTTAEQQERAAKEKEDQERAELAAREADAEIVEKDKSRFVEGERKRELAKEEEAAVEAWRPRRD